MRTAERLDIVVLGLSLTSSWGNGHAATYRALLGALAARGHRLLFLERDAPSYAAARDLPNPSFCAVGLYGSVRELTERYAERVRQADLVIQGSFVPDGIEVASWMLGVARGCTAFYDLDTPVTMAALRNNACDYLARAQVPRFDLYLSFTGGATLRRLETAYGARRARPLHCSFDDAAHFPSPQPPRWELGYMGTYSRDRQPALEALLVAAARRLPQRRFAVVGPLYPPRLAWPDNVERIQHLPPPAHRDFYCSQAFTLNLTRADMKEAGHSPSARLFQAAACATPILSDPWPGLSDFFTPGEEILVVNSTREVVQVLSQLSPEKARSLGENARRRALMSHTAHHRAGALERYVGEVLRRALPRSTTTTRQVRRSRASQRYM